jgi:5'-3' exonuclease
MRVLHLIDATFELFRAYHALPSATAPDGREVGAIRGLIASMLALLRDAAVSHVAAATDHVIESFRNRLFAGYKTGDGIPPDLWAQFSLAEEALDALGIVVWPMVEFEADDAIASAAVRFAGQVDQVVILSPDKDLAQCVDGERVVTYDRIRRITYDEAAVRAKFGVAPAAIPDFLALVGDSADGLPGIPGWGSKSAAAVLAVYGCLEAIPADPETWRVSIRHRPRLAAALDTHRTDAQLYKTLATLRRDVSLAERLDDLHWRGVPRRRFEALCARLGVVDLTRRPVLWRPD